MTHISVSGIILVILILMINPVIAEGPEDTFWDIMTNVSPTDSNFSVIDEWEDELEAMLHSPYASNLTKEGTIEIIVPENDDISVSGNIGSFLEKKDVFEPSRDRAEENPVLKTDWLLYEADPRFSIYIPPSWTPFRVTTTNSNGTVVMFWDNQMTPSFISVMAADNPAKRAFTEKEATEIENSFILPSFSVHNLTPLGDAAAFGTLGKASVSYLPMAGKNSDWVVSSYLLSDSSAFFWLTAIGTDQSTYMENTDLYSDILMTFSPHSSEDAGNLWMG